MLTLDKVYHAAYVLRECARKTDLIAAPLLSEEHNLYLKTENLQVTGSFKLRGAYYKISQNSSISMTEFKRKARRHYTDNKKCEYINTRAISLDTYISRLK